MHLRGTTYWLALLVFGSIALLFMRYVAPPGSRMRARLERWGLLERRRSWVWQLLFVVVFIGGIALIRFSLYPVYQ